ncbi:hypothetical protein C8J56DRAFT_787096 [Mycena floridula]|nr:hypothetical protein C8J56DRAFT_787096 [Mycena floridula]
MGRSRPLAEQRSRLKPVLTADLTGKVICITGANTGLGFQAAKHFARMNPQKLILTSRDEEKGNKALKELIKETGFQRAEVWMLDLCSFRSVQRFADKAIKELERLDVLVANAGMLPVTVGELTEVTEDGCEVCLQVNDLSQELLALLLLPKMLETAKRFAVVPRLVVVSSGLHCGITEPDVAELLNATNIFEMLSSKEYCTSEKMRRRYEITKLFNVFFVRAISAHLPPSLLVNCISPGFCCTDGRRNLPPDEAAYFEALEREVGITAEEGSRQLVYGAVAGLGNAEEEEKLRAKYISFSEVFEESDFCISEAGFQMQTRIWDETLELLSKVDPRVTEIVREHLI